MRFSAGNGMRCKAEKGISPLFMYNNWREWNEQTDDETNNRRKGAG